MEAKPLLIAAFMLLLVSSAAAAPAEGTSANSALDTLISINPLILIIAGVVLFFAASLAKVVGVVLVIIGAISLILSII